MSTVISTHSLNMQQYFNLHKKGTMNKAKRADKNICTFLSSSNIDVLIF